jgi:hypothetical protein
MLENDLVMLEIYLIMLENDLITLENYLINDRQVDACVETDEED